jgi:hypothetical protein
MHKLSEYYNRICLVLWMLTMRFSLFAQGLLDGDDDEDVGGGSGLPSLLEDEEQVPSFGFHFGFTDILIGIVVIAIFFVMSNSKLKKGCWYSVLYLILVMLLVTKCV